MRPRGETQRRYNEAIQSLSGKKSEKPVCATKIIVKSSPPLNIVRRRTSCPQVVLQLWKAILFIRQQKQISNFARISAFMKRVHHYTPEEVEKQLKNAVDDGLVAVKTVIGCKGTKIGVEQDGYRIPDLEIKKDDHDWYCFTCHKGGEMALCTTCYRVFHEECIKGPYDSAKFICDICQLQKWKLDVDVKKEEINELLNHTCVRLKEKTRELHRLPYPNEDKQRHDLFVYHPMDLCTMEQKMRSNLYESLEEFYSDALQVVHNVIICYGELTRHAAMARQMIFDCEYDLNEIEQCRQCYRMSNAKDEKNWFCQPCNPPHELVFAKYKGFPFWPAKVIRKEGEFYDVRFFGGFHQRAYIHEEFVRPITESLQSMGLKRTASLLRALSELNRHQSLVAEQQGGKVNKVSSRKRKFESKSPTMNNSNETPVKNTKAAVFDNVLESQEIVAKKSKPNFVEKKRIKSKQDPSNLKRNASNPPPSKRRRAKQDSYVSDNIEEVPNDVDSDIPIKLKNGQGRTEELNVVSSSSQELSVSYSTSATQTSSSLLKEYMTEDMPKELGSKDSEVTCSCAEKFSQMLEEVKDNVKSQLRKEKEKAVKERAEMIKKEMEEEKKKFMTAMCLQHEKRLEEIKKKKEEEDQLLHQAELEKLMEAHRQQISEVKKKQWCYNCELEAIYHCCWNTAYCSVECQQVHWHREHKRTCRRKR